MLKVTTQHNCQLCGAMRSRLCELSLKLEQYVMDPNDMMVEYLRTMSTIICDFKVIVNNRLMKNKSQLYPTLCLNHGPNETCTHAQ